MCPYISQDEIKDWDKQNESNKVGQPEGRRDSGSVCERLVPRKRERRDMYMFREEGLQDHNKNQVKGGVNSGTVSPEGTERQGKIIRRLQ